VTAWQFALYTEKALTGAAKIAPHDGAMTMLVEVVVEKRTTISETYRTFRPATPEDCERIRLRRLRDRMGVEHEED
jgi:hypothetical protein